MSATLISIIAGGGVILAFLFGWIFKRSTDKSEQLGSVKATAEAQQKIDAQAIEQREARIEDIKDAQEIHTRVDVDPTYRDSVRDRFTRD